MFKPEVLLLLLHLCVSPLGHRQVTDLIFYRVHDTHWHTINLAQIDRSRVHLTVNPLVKGDRLLKLPGQADLSEVELAAEGLSVTEVIDVLLVESEEFPLFLIIARRHSFDITG